MATQLGRKVTVNLLTGFLGSGKTTLLRRLLAEPDLAGTAVLVNEFGEVGLDHLLLEEVDEDVVLLQSGCVCCTIRGDLKDAMLRLHERAHKGEIPVFERLAIETTGLADPAPIVATLEADPVLRNHYRLGNVVTVVDAVSGVSNIEHYEESRKQVAVADRIVVTKTDLAEADALDDVLVRLNPTAALVHGGEDQPVSETLFTADIHDEAAKREEVERWLRQSGHDHGHHHGSGIGSFVIEAEEPLDWAAFGLWLSMLLNRHGQKILRVKGLLRVSDIDRPVVIHGVQHTIHKPVHLDAWPWGEARTQLVMIVDGIDADAVKRSFDRLVRRL
jgi:G3E family GTPase